MFALKLKVILALRPVSQKRFGPAENLLVRIIVCNIKHNLYFHVRSYVTILENSQVQAKFNLQAIVNY